MSYETPNEDLRIELSRLDEELFKKLGKETYKKVARMCEIENELGKRGL